MQRLDGAHGTSVGVCERFASDDAYAQAKALVRDTVRNALDSDSLLAAVEAYGAARATGHAEGDLAFLGAMAVHGAWNAHDVVWDQLEDALAVEETTPGGLLLVRPRFTRDLERFADSLRDLATLRALALTEGLTLDPTSNIFLNEGTDLLWRRFTNIAVTDQPFDSNRARIGIGDSTTAESRQHTGLQAATNKTFKAMEAGFPTATLSTSSTLGSKSAYKSVFDGTSANYGHKEWVIDNKNNGGGQTAGVITLNRKQQDFGTKASGSVWTYTFEARID